MSTQPTPQQIGQIGASNLVKMYGTINAASIAAYNKNVAFYASIYGTQPNASAPKPPQPPMLTTVDQELYIQIEIGAQPESQWPNVLIQFPYVPVAPPPPTPATPLYIIGAANPYMPGFFAVSVSTNSHDDLKDGTIINAGNEATPDGHTYVLHSFGFAGNVLAQMTS